MKYVDFNDESIPIGKRKVAYVKFAMSKGTSQVSARTQANKKFGWEEKELKKKRLQDDDNAWMYQPKNKGE